MATELARIAELSAQNPTMVFTSIAHLINVKLLRECHEKMDGDKAVGIDGVTKEEYGKNLEENLVDLVARMKKRAYKPKPARRVEIPKDNGKTRPLSIYCYEDKLVQEALRRVLEAVYEPMFYDEMMGFRPGRSCHQALRKLNTMIERNYTNYILDADIKGFFDHLDHGMIIKFVGSRIKDPNIIRLVRRMLKAGIMKDFIYEPTEEGSGQGVVILELSRNRLSLSRHNSSSEIFLTPLATQPFSMPGEKNNYQTYVFSAVLLFCSHQQKGGEIYDSDSNYRRSA